jgi:3-methyladenine DNA glycosylase AlkD
VIEAIRSGLAELADPAKAPGMQAYMKSSMPFRGVGSPVLAALCSEVFDSHPLDDEEQWRAAVRDLWDDAAYREERYAAIALAGHRAYRRHQQPGTLPLYEHLVVTGAWWDLADPVATNRVGPILLAHREEVGPVMWRWAEDPDLWLRRTAILCQLHHKQATDLALLRHAVESNLEGSLHGKEFFVRKAIGWGLRQYARTDPMWVRGLVAELGDRLSALSRREALKHIG